MNILRRWCWGLVALGCVHLGGQLHTVFAQEEMDFPAAMEAPPLDTNDLLTPKYPGYTSRDYVDGFFQPSISGSLFGGADFLLVRPTWSEAVAFARGQQTPASLVTQGETIAFGYDSSLRAFLGWRPAEGPSEFRFTYWNLQGKVDNSGTVSGPGQFIVDPFGNLVGAVVVIDPSDGRFGGPPLVGGDRVDTHTSVEVNAFDLNYRSAVPLGDTCWSFAWDTGVRISNIEQYYDSVVTTAGVETARGVFTADFTGAGPRLGGEFQRSGPRLAFYMNAHGSLLLGGYNVVSTVNPVPVFTAGQDNSMTRMIPVLESEIGLHWQVTPRTLVSGGWLFQSWFDLGTSGGTFSGFFNGADDANVMAFDGLFIRGEFSF